MDIEGGDGREAREATPVDHALDALSTAVDHLVKVVEDGGLDGYDDAGLLGFARLFEQVRRRAGLVDHRLVRDLEARRVAETLGQPSTGRCWPGCCASPGARPAGGSGRRSSWV